MYKETKCSAAPESTCTLGQIEAVPLVTRKRALRTLCQGHPWWQHGPSIIAASLQRENGATLNAQAASLRRQIVQRRRWLGLGMLCAFRVTTSELSFIATKLPVAMSPKLAMPHVTCRAGWQSHLQVWSLIHALPLCPESSSPHFELRACMCTRPRHIKCNAEWDAACRALCCPRPALVLRKTGCKGEGSGTQAS